MRSAKDPFACQPCVPAEVVHTSSSGAVGEFAVLVIDGEEQIIPIVPSDEGKLKLR